MEDLLSLEDYILRPLPFAQIIPFTGFFLSLIQLKMFVLFACVFYLFPIYFLLHLVAAATVCWAVSYDPHCA